MQVQLGSFGKNLTSTVVRHLPAERVLVQAHFRRHPKTIVDRQHIEAAGTFTNVTLAQKSPRGAHHDALLVGGHAQFRQGGQRIVAHGARPHFNERQRDAVVSDQIDLALAPRGM